MRLFSQSGSDKPEKVIDKPSFHMRPLPETLVKLSSPEGKVLFREALSLGGMEGYFYLAEHFLTQAEPSFCSVSTLAMVLNTINSLKAKSESADCEHPVKYFSEVELSCKLEEVEKNGMTLADFANLAQKHGVM
jgi:glutathione gamma-glutamylcysteinyltransferase